MKQSQDKNVTMIAVCVVLLVVCVAGLFYLGTRAGALSNQVKTLGAENTNLSAQVVNLSSNLNHCTSELGYTEQDLQSKETAFVDYKSILKQQVSKSKVVLEDTQKLASTIDSLYTVSSSDTVAAKNLVADYDSELTTLKAHTTEYQDLLKAQKVMFTEMGINVDDEIKSENAALDKYDAFLTRLKTYVATLK